VVCVISDAVWDAELVESREHVLHGFMYYMGCIHAPMGRGTFGVSRRLRSIVKHRILGVWVKG